MHQSRCPKKLNIYGKLTNFLAASFMARSTRALLIPFDFILRVLLNDGVKVGGAESVNEATTESCMEYCISFYTDKNETIARNDTPETG